MRDTIDFIQQDIDKMEKELARVEEYRSQLKDAIERSYKELQDATERQNISDVLVKINTGYLKKEDKEV